MFLASDNCLFTALRCFLARGRLGLMCSGDLERCLVFLPTTSSTVCSTMLRAAADGDRNALPQRCASAGLAIRWRRLRFLGSQKRVSVFSLFTIMPKATT